MQTQDVIYQVNCALPMFTNIPDDVMVNTFHFRFPGTPPATPPTITDYGKLFDRLKTFYDAVYLNLIRANYMGNTMAMKVYDLSLPLPHVPQLSGTRTIAGTAQASNLPTEVAMCLSMRATYIGGVAQARQRGRIFIGGFAAGVDSSTTTSFPQFGAAARTAIGAAASALRTGALADGWVWSILSGAQVAEVKQNSFDVAAGFIDNSPDTQRRRSVVATARTLW